MPSITSNISAYYAQNNLKTAADEAQASISRLSSGNKIVRASDDVAALSIGTILRTNVNTLKTALTNANQGTTLLQIADGALSQVGEILQRQKALATQALSGTLGVKERGYLDQEFQALKNELNRIATTTNFNGTNLIDGNLVTGGSIITQETATMANNFAELTDTSDTIDTAILTGGENALGLSNNGTADNSTLNKLFGSLAEASVSVTDGSAGDTVQATITINGVSFSTAVNAIDLDNTNTDIAFTATDGSGVVITLDIADQGVTTPGSTEATTFEDALEAEIRKLSLYQSKAISDTSGDEGAILDTDTDGTILDGMTGDDFVIRTKSGFGLDPDAASTTVVKATAPSISNFVVTSHSSTSATFSVEVDGVTYTARRATVDGDIRAQNFGSDADGNALGTAGQIKLYNLDDLQSYVTIDFGQTTAASIGVASQDEADRIAVEINRLFGSGSSGGAEFAIGTDSSDSITVSIDSVKTDALYKDENGSLQTLDVTTATNASDASDILDLAIQRVTAARANVGALQSRFGYAAATISVSVQNLDAARSTFLDTDVSAESTSFATSQVLQQASISVLAQANQLPQNLLKLIA